ncbi:MAG: shikimate dehydrogenase [bacterium]|nr:shikimate dehydrogenase [bacterium]
MNEQGAGRGAREGGTDGDSQTGGVPTIALGMGDVGLPSRVLAKKFGALATYCAPSAGDETAPGQVTLEQMLDDYRWAAIDERTRFFGVIGDPVAHSMSPRLFNACFERENVNGVYLPLHVQADGDVLARFLQGCQDRPWLDVGGFSVTVPHKQAAAAWVGDRIEPLARRIGAVNTLVPREDGLAGFNADYAGALEAITGALKCDRAALADLRADVLGAGGVARAMVAGLRDCGARVTLFNRSADRAKVLADEFDCVCRPWSDRNRPSEADLLINCTSLGMWPEVDETPVSAERLAEPLVVFDTVYNPVQTRLLREAAAAGCRIIDGLTMFVNQAALQWAIWMGRSTADKALMRRVVERCLTDTPAG